MSAPAANCPNCGAPIVFRWSSAVQTTCEFCHSILVRTDVDLEKVGEVADLPPDASPIQIGTEGIFKTRASWSLGGSCMPTSKAAGMNGISSTNDGSSGWLSDAQLEYDLSWLAHPPSALPARDGAHPGFRVQWSGKTYEITSVTKAHYKGVQGELPFQYWDKAERRFSPIFALRMAISRRLIIATARPNSIWGAQRNLRS